MVEQAKKMPSDVDIFFTWHPEVANTANVIGETKIQKARTLGKLFDDKIGGIEPLFTTVLHTYVDHRSPNPDEKYYFITQAVGNTAKSPREMFGRILIPNNFAYIKKRMIEYGQGITEKWDAEFNEKVYSALTADDFAI